MKETMGGVPRVWGCVGGGLSASLCGAAPTHRCQGQDCTHKKDAAGGGSGTLRGYHGECCAITFVGYYAVFSTMEYEQGLVFVNERRGMHVRGGGGGGGALSN